MARCFAWAAVWLAALAAPALAATCTSNAAGNWSAAGTWSCAHAPANGDAVVINHGIVLDATTNDLASLTVNTGGSLRLSGSTGYDIHLGGNLVNHGTLDFQSSSSTNTIYLVGSNVTATLSGDDGTWLLDNLDLNGHWFHSCSGACKVELSGSPHLKFANSSLFSGNSSSMTFNAAGNATATVELNLAGSQSIQTTGAVFPHLVISGSGTKTPASGTLTILGSLTIGAGTTFNGNSNDPNVNLGGNFSNGGSFSSGSGTWTFNGNAAQTIAGTPTFANLIINNAAGVALSGNVTVSGSIAYTSGKLSTGSDMLIVSGTCPGTARGSATSFVLGNLRLTIPGGASTCVFDVGDTIGYAPVTTTFAGATSGTLTVRSDAGDHADTAAGLSGIDATKSANHYWTLTTGTLTSYTSYAATFRYCALSVCTAAEVDSGAATGSFMVARKTSGSWSLSTVTARTAYSAQASGLTALGQFAVGQAAMALCFTDDFNRSDGAPGGNWSAGRQYGSYTPAIAGNRLRLTNTGTAEATWATLQRYFPGAGNKITVDFDHYAYNGSGADGIAVILSNAAVAPVVGAFGGSLGYAPKSNPGSDCTTPGGCPGFTGGWIGVAIDEYGNFQNPTEGRYGGPGSVPDSVSIRGSGSGMSGYRYMAGTGALSPGVDGSFSPAHHYRITVDHSDNVHAYVTVERDTTSGGAAYTAIIPQFDAKDPAYSQDAVPANWQLSLTGSSGAATNIHEIDALRICTTSGMTIPTLDHIRILHGGSACTGTANPADITLMACADAACSSLYLDSVTVNLNTISGTNWSADPVTFSGGRTTLTLSKTAAGSVSLGGTSTVPTAANATRCFNGASETCTLTFAACYLDAVESGAASYTPIYTKLAGTSFNLDVKNISGTTQSVTAVEIVDASTGATCDAYTSLAQATRTAGGAAPWSFNTWSTATQSFTFNYASAVRNARIRIASGSGKSCSTDNFAIRPMGLTLTSSADQTGSSGTPIVKAGGETFWIKATGLTGYDGTPKFDLTSAGVITGTSATGTLGAAAFGAASGGAATASNLTYSEVGNIALAQRAVYDDSFATVDSAKTPPECTSDFSNTLNASGMYGCMFGSAALTLGRFVPDHFKTTVVHGCPAGSFTYSGQPFGAGVVLVEAVNAAGSTTTNYQGSYARSVTLTDGGSAAVPCTTNCAIADTWFLSGKSMKVSGSPPTPSYPPAPTFGWPAGTLKAPATLNLRATDGDGIASTTASGGTTELRLGRLRLSNAFGSERIALAMPVQAQYWSGSTWVLNNADSCTTIPANAFALSNGLTSVAGAVAIAGGNGTLNLTAPGAGNVGSVDIAANLGAAGQDTSCLATHGGVAAGVPWLRSQFGSCTAATGFVADPSARATFGIYSPESRRTVHVRETF